MVQLVLRPAAVSEEAGCGLCGGACRPVAGHAFHRADDDQPVCEACARKEAPALVALVHLGSAAERISRRGRQSVFPPLTALLDLAAAAEKYTAVACPPAAE